jgi:hypothetical protein
LFRFDAFPAEVCLVPEITPMACHSTAALIEVSDAGGRTAGEIADEAVAQAGFEIERSTMSIAGERAVVLNGVPGQDLLRDVLIVHDDRLYRLRFVQPYPDDPPETVERFETLYDMVIGSLTFLPIVPPPEPTGSSEPNGSAVVGHQGWMCWFGRRRPVPGRSSTRRCGRVGAQRRRRVVAFVHLCHRVRWRTPSGLFPWIVGWNGTGSRELLSADELRRRLGLAESESVAIPELHWIPNSHRLLYTVSFSDSAFSAGLYLVDVDNLAEAEILPTGESAVFMPSPDGAYIGLMRWPEPGPPFFVNVDDAAAGRVHFIQSPGAALSREALGWTQDSTAFLVKEFVPSGRRSTIWRVPVSGAAEPLVSVDGDRVQLAPDGSSVSAMRATGPLQPSGRFLTALPDDLGPLAVYPDALGLSWSPSSTAYVVGDEAMSPLCSSAAQAIEFCEPSIPFGEPIQWLEWLDRDRFLYLTYVPKRLMLGSLDGSAALIAVDPQAPPDAGGPTIALSFAAVASTCRDDSEFVSDVTIPDGTPFAAGSVFQKTWRVRNTGDCAWDASYRLTFLSGDRMSGPRSAPLEVTVQPGQDVELSVLLIAPESAGTYLGTWQLFSLDGKPFGTAPYVSIQVP